MAFESQQMASFASIGSVTELHCPASSDYANPRGMNERVNGWNEWPHPPLPPSSDCLSPGIMSHSSPPPKYEFEWIDLGANLVNWHKIGRETEERTKGCRAGGGGDTIHRHFENWQRKETGEGVGKRRRVWHSSV